MHFILMFSRQGKLRLQKWYDVQIQVSSVRLSSVASSLALQKGSPMVYLEGSFVQL
jgi:hypothetical protein